MNSDLYDSYREGTTVCALCLSKETNRANKLVRTIVKKPVLDEDLVLVPAGAQMMHERCRKEILDHIKFKQSWRTR